MDAFYLKIRGGHRRALPIYDLEADRKDIVLELYRKVVPDLHPLWVGSTFSKYRQNTTILQFMSYRKKSRNLIRLSVQYTIGQIGDICTNLRKNP